MLSRSVSQTRHRNMKRWVMKRSSMTRPTWKVARMQKMMIDIQKPLTPESLMLWSPDAAPWNAICSAEYRSLL